MILRKKITYTGILAMLGVWGITGNVSAKENINSNQHRSGFKTTAEAGLCLPATAAIDLDINNVRARLMTGGDMWWNIGQQVAAYEVPKNSGKSSQFAASCWIGGYDQQGQLKVAAQTYRQDGNDYWPGALNDVGKITKDTCDLWDRFWKVDRSTINQFINLFKTSGQSQAQGKEYAVINEWPATGNDGSGLDKKVFGTKGRDGKTPISLYKGRTYAPFKDLNTDGLYQPQDGEYPLITGDQYIWWVFNDAGNTKQQSITASMGIEVQTSAFAYATQDFLNDATFCQYRVINRGALTIDSTYIAVWDDLDLGYYKDDYIGCDTSRGLGISYNGTNDDGGGAGHPVNSYGLNPPQVGLDFFQGPLRPIKRVGLPDTVERLGMTNFTYYNNDNSIIGNPNNGIQIYFYMTGSIRTGQRFSYDFIGPGQPSKGYGVGPVSNFVFWGDPGDNSQWSECACNNNPDDRRFIFSSGPFQLLPGAMNDIVFGCVWAKGVGGCGATNFKTIKSIDDQAQGLFDNKFKTVEGPEAPRMEVRELDRKLVFYLVNDYGSNNFSENYGRTDGSYNDSLNYHQISTKAVGKPDSLYKFEGYRVFQLANSQITSAEIFDPVTGEVDNTKAYEVFQCDVKNGITQIVNYGSNISVSGANTFPQIKVNGKDSGLTHSFVLTNDQFSTGADKRFINYHTYYFVAIAYSYNNFTAFDPANVATTQDVAYLGSAHGIGGTEIKIVQAVPNPANGAMGTVLNSDYGSGITVTRLEGVGNGGYDIALNQETEDAIIKNGSQGKLVYKQNQGPIGVKVVDPVRVPAYDWILQILGPNTTTGISDTGRWMLTAYDGNTKADVIYGERNLGGINEQILEDYGLAVEVNQVKAAGVDQKAGNGYITSEVVFDEVSKPWLWGVQDEADSSFANWIRSGNNQKYTHPLAPLTNPCHFNDGKLDTGLAYANLLSNFTPTKGTWAPYVLVAAWQGFHAGSGTQCGFQFAFNASTQKEANFKTLNDVDVVFTSDKSKWTKCAVIEMQEDPALAQGYNGKANSKFLLREHAGWSDPNLVAADNITPIYSDDDSEKGMSWFPGYAIDQNTGKRLNIVFGEDSYMGSNNGDDMVWNPTFNKFNFWDGSIIFGGKHAVYIMGSAYDSCKAFARGLRTAAANPTSSVWRNTYASMQWVGIPLLNPEVSMKSLKDGLIPTKTRLRFRVNQPYAPALGVTDTTVATLKALPSGANPTNPYYTFSTTGLAPTPVGDKTDKGSVLDRIYAVPNPYFGYSGYESNRFDTKVRIINLPAKVTVRIYSLDGALIRTLTKNDPNTPYLDWDIRNSAGLPISSGMYVMHVQADGLGETVLKWFGAMRPIDVTTY